MALTSPEIPKGIAIVNCPPKGMEAALWYQFAKVLVNAAVCMDEFKVPPATGLKVKVAWVASRVVENPMIPTLTPPFTLVRVTFVITGT